MDNNRLRCEICGRSHFETPIIEKPLRFGSKANIYTLSQVNNDNRKQDNICLDCLKKEIEKVSLATKKK